ncbi:hypothetical protein [uncultured Gammaproteobacteria bacterium]|nr:hypothetical protein [uncultured Gammaproteobacteria bacterium]
MQVKKLQYYKLKYKKLPINSMKKSLLLLKAFSNILVVVVSVRHL